MKRRHQLDKRVVYEITHKKPLDTIPKWCLQYIVLYPDVLESVPATTTLDPTQLYWRYHPRLCKCYMCSAGFW